MPYRENLDRLLREETVRDELVHFSLDEENSIVAPGHRHELVPILVRFVFVCLFVKCREKYRFCPSLDVNLNVFLFVGFCMAA